VDGANRPPRDFDGFVQAIFALLARSRQLAEPLVACITASISRVIEPIEAAYGPICGVLNDLSGYEDLRAVCLRCFGNLARLAPVAMAADIEQLVELVGASLGTGEFALMQGAAVCLAAMIPPLASAIAPAIDPLVEALFSVLASDLVKPGENGEDGPGGELKRDLMMCLATFIRYLPRLSAPWTPAFLEIMGQPSGESIFKACQWLSAAAPGLKAMNCDPFPILLPLVTELPGRSDIEPVGPLHWTVGDLVRAFVYIDPVTLVKIREPIFRGLDEHFVEYCLVDTGSVVNLALLEPMFYALWQVMRAMGPLGQAMRGTARLLLVECGDELLLLFHKYLKYHTKMQKAYALESLARLAFLLRDTGDLFRLVLDTALKWVWKAQSRLRQRCCLNSLSLLIQINVEPFAADLGDDSGQTRSGFVLEGVDQLLAEFASGNVEDEELRHAAVSLWCIAVMHFDAQPDPARLALVMGMLPPPVDSDHIPAAALFAVFATQRWPELVADRFPYVAAAVLASCEWQLTAIPPEIIPVLAQALAQWAEEDLPTLFLGHQGNALKLVETLERLKSGES
jgi:hypothetical protein